MTEQSRSGNRAIAPPEKIKVGLAVNGVYRQLSLAIRKTLKRIMIDFHYSRCVHSLDCHRVGGEWK